MRGGWRGAVRDGRGASCRARNARAEVRTHIRTHSKVLAPINGRHCSQILVMMRTYHVTITIKPSHHNDNQNHITIIIEIFESASSLAPHHGDPP